MDILKYDIYNNVYTFSTRRSGGVSTGAYSSFNANPYCGDKIENVVRNQQLLADALNIDITQIIIPHQIHHSKILKIDNRFIQASDKMKKILLDGIDALITNIPNYCICVTTADCIPIVIYDAENRATACIHSGWRGTLDNICQKTIVLMSKEYGTHPSQCKVVIGPGISLRNFEVGDEVYAMFKDKGYKMESISAHYDKWHIDLPGCIKHQLMNCDINATNIHMSNICTYDNYSNYFSARRLGIQSGRILTGIMLNN